MPSAFVLINCKHGLEQRVVYELKLLQEIVEADRIYGVYNVIVKVKTDTLEELKVTINWKIRTIRGIESTLTFFEIPERRNSSNNSTINIANDNVRSEKDKADPLIESKRKKLAAGAS
jgi:DNA-binding Lrp family transcriptional regulator